MQNQCIVITYFLLKKAKENSCYIRHTQLFLLSRNFFPEIFLAIAKKLFYNVKEPFSASCNLEGELSSSLTIGVLASDAFSLRESKYLLLLDETNPIAFYHEQHWNGSI